MIHSMCCILHGDQEEQSSLCSRLAVVLKQTDKPEQRIVKASSEVYQMGQIYNVGIVDVDLSTQHKTTQNFPATLSLDQKCVLKCVCV